MPTIRRAMVRGRGRRFAVVGVQPWVLDDPDDRGFLVEDATSKLGCPMALAAEVATGKWRAAVYSEAPADALPVPMARCSRSGGKPSIGDQIRSGYIGRIVASRKNGRLGHLACVAEATQRKLSHELMDHALHVFLRHAQRSVDRRLDRAGTQHVDSNATGCELGRKRTNERTNRGLAWCTAYRAISSVA